MLDFVLSWLWCLSLFDIFILFKKKKNSEGKCVNCKKIKLTEKFILLSGLQNVFTDKVLI